jgi:type I restriction enzyme R subunit
VVGQDKKDLNLFAAQGVACREAVMKSGHGRADYLLYVDKQVVGVIEAKPEGTTLSGIEWQSAMYATGLPPEAQLRSVAIDGRLPFVFEASGTETHLTNSYDPNPQAPHLQLPQPEALAASSARPKPAPTPRPGAPRSSTSLHWT